ncbi:MAG: CCA tRNA nucleotidyltransferase [Gemmataceae bacterium]|nr:CCA tRNA nucleotidyltransferase [Gemmataceae bacterium]
MTEREFAIDVVKRLHEAGHQALWAGGCVRDELLGLVPKDYDVATDAKPEQVRKLFRRTIAVGASFGVVEVLGPKVDGTFLKVQVATFRTDGAYSDGRRPDEVVYSTAEEDAQRRDFTVNGMFFDPLAGTLVDYVGGQADLHARVLRAIGDPALRFEEDKLRLLRAVRMATRFELALDPATEDAIRRMAPQIHVVSAERIAEELRQLLVHPRRVRGLNLLRDLGLADAILPEIVTMRGLPQGLPNSPTGDLWDHVMAVLDFIGPSPSFPLAMATLLHDVGKPRTVGRTAERYTFYHHEHVGSRIAAHIAERLRLSNVESDRIVWLVEKHQYLADAALMRTAKLKMMLAHPGIRELLALHRADALASGHSVAHVDYCERLLEEWTEADLNPELFLNGHDLMRRGIPRGPLYKKLLDGLREAQLEGTVKNGGQAWELVERLLNEQSPPVQQE